MCVCASFSYADQLDAVAEAASTNLTALSATLYGELAAVYEAVQLAKAERLDHAAGAC